MIKSGNRKQQAERTKREIFEAALRLLDKKKLDDITVRDIVKEANVSIGSFYNYYNTKLEVFYETYVLADEYFETNVKNKLTEVTYCDRILHFFREYGYYQTYVGSYSLTKVLYNSDNNCFHRVSSKGIVPILIDLCKGAKNNGEFNTIRTPEYIAQFLMICVRGISYDWCISGGVYDLSDKFSEYVQLLLNSFK